MYLLAATNRSFKVYALPTLKIKFLGPTLSHKISAVEVSNEIAFVAGENSLQAFHFHHVVNKRSFDHAITALFLLDKELVVCLDEGSLVVVSSTSFQVTRTVRVPHEAKVVVHPPTYVNKLLVAGGSQLTLLNISSGKILFEFQAEPSLAELFKHEVSALRESPAPDVVAVGFASGDAILLNIRTCEVVASLKMKSPVRQFAFTRDPAGAPLLFIASRDLPLACFDLNK